MKPSIPPTYEQDQTSLNDILQPLLDLLNSQYRYQRDEAFAITNNDSVGINSRDDGVLITLPINFAFRPMDYPTLKKVLVTLLHESGSSSEWLQPGGGSNEAYREPLRFSLVTRTVWHTGFCFFASAMRLHVDMSIYGSAAAKRQIAYLVERLSDVTNLHAYNKAEGLRF